MNISYVLLHNFLGFILSLDYIAPLGDDGGSDYVYGPYEYSYDNPTFGTDNARSGDSRRIEMVGSRRRDNQHIILQTVQNPYYGVDDTKINSKNKTDAFVGQVANIKVVENPYYAEDDVTNREGDNQEIILKAVENPYYGIDNTAVN